MANLKVLDGDAAAKYMKTSGAGSDVDPHIPTHAVTVASAAIASGAIASGAVASGAIASGAVASGAVAAGAFALGAISLPTAIVHGQKTVTAAGTEEALGASTTLYSGVRVKALHGNTGWVYVGANPVTSATGFVLDAGEDVFIEAHNLTDVWLDTSVSGEGASYIGS